MEDRPISTALLQGVNVALVGMMGAGKTTVAQHLANQLGYRFVDTDQLVEQVTGRAIADIFATEGEAHFRTLESQVLAEVCAYTHMAIATGGGIVLNQMNWSYLRHGIVVWLDVPVSELYRRLAQDQQRPLLQTADPEKTLATILNQRQHLYAQADVQVTVPAGMSPADLAAKVLAEIEPVLRKSQDIAPAPGSIVIEGN